jgi:putative transposase
LATKRRRPEEIVSELRQVEVLTGYGKSFAEVVKTFVVTEKTHFRRRVEHGRAED